MLVECQNCGAPLNVRDDSIIFVRCSYCAKTNRVRTMRTTAVQTPSGWAPPPTWQPPPNYRFQPPQPLSHRPASQISQGMVLVFVVSIVLPMVAMFTCGVVQFAVSRSRSSVPDRPAETPARVLELDADPWPIPFTVTARSGTSASRRTDRGACRGEISDEPQLILRTSRLTPYSLRAMASNDTVLVLETAAGEFLCDDDSGGSLNPRLDGLLRPGTHRVWLGTVLEGDDGTNATIYLRSASEALAPSASPTLGDRMGLGAQSWEGQVAATVDASQYGGSCPGFVSAAPQVRIDVAEPVRAYVAVTSTSGGDLFALLRAPDESVRCAPLSRQVAFDLVPGVSTLWVGTMDLMGDEAYHLEMTW